MKRFISKGLFGIFVAIAGGAIALYLNQQIQPKELQLSESKESVPDVHFVDNKYTSGSSINFEQAAERSIDGVVHVRTEKYITNTNPYYFFYYGGYTKTPVRSAGSGVIISDDGYIVTNNHVIDGADNIEITLNNNKEYKARLVGKDPSTDLALLKIAPEENLSFVSYGNSNQLKVGEWVLAVGNPYNLTSTVTAGIVSAKGRNINILKGDPRSGLGAIESFIQTDAVVNPGNSGGALVNTQGDLVGINAAIQSNTGSYTGYSFAIPVNIVKRVVDDLKQYGVVKRALLGVVIQEVTQDVADHLNLSEVKGIYIANVTPNGAASKAGIRKGDIITHINRNTTNDLSDLQEQIGQYTPGSLVNVRLLRNGQMLSVDVKLQDVKNTMAFR